MKVGVTGANGFIGQHVVEQLRKRGDEVVALVRDPSTVKDCETRVVDFSQPRNLDDIVAGLEGVIHAAAHIPKSYADPNEARPCMDINALGTLSLLLACVRAGVPRAVILSGNVYRPGLIAQPESGPIDPSRQAPYYLISKATADLYAQAIAREGEIGIAILRISAVYGPGLARGMIPSFIIKLEAGEALTINDAGRYRADTVYVKDVASACVSALRSPLSGPVNVGSGTTSSVIEIAETIARSLGASLDLLHVLPANEKTSVTGFSPLDIGLARTALGYEPRNLEAGIADYVGWWRARS